MNITFRKVPEKNDAGRVREIVASTGFFYDHEIEIAVELVLERLKSGEASGYFFVFAEVGGVPVAYTCFGKDDMTRSCFELYWIVTHADYRGKGIGKMLLEETYREARRMGCTMIIAETSGREHYAPTRAFYEKTGYTLEAVIKDYYDKGDDKCFYVKRFE